MPTRDIHMNQVGLEKLWLTVLKDYVRPLQEMIFTGYYQNVSMAYYAYNAIKMRKASAWRLWRNNNGNVASVRNYWKRKK